MKKESIFRIFFIMLIIMGMSLVVNIQNVYASGENIAFDSGFYADMNPDLKAVFGYDYASLKNHWENYGVVEGRKSSKIFDVKYYLNNNMDLGLAFGKDDYKSAYNHFVNYGVNEGRKTSMVFDIQYYLNCNEDIKDVFKTDYQAVYGHFLNYGINEGRKTSVIFDTKYYLDNNGDLKNAFDNNYQAAYCHFITYGIREGRKTSSTFDVQYYLDNNNDIKDAFGDNYEAAYNHYLSYGIEEKRNCIPEGKVIISQIISAQDISSNPSEYYGQTVSYTPANGDTSVGWRIFYADDNNIYLIADKCIETAKAPTKNGKSVVASGEYYASLNCMNIDNAGFSVATEYSGVSDITRKLINRWLIWGEEYPQNNGNANTKATAYLMDTEIWNVSYGNNNTDYVLGSPTVEMFIASWNAKGYTELSYTTDSVGYRITAEGIEPSNNDCYNLTNTEGFSDTLYYPAQQHTSGYWLASPFSASYVDYATDYIGSGMPVLYYNGNIGPYWTTMSSAYGLRPVVCLKAGVELKEQKDGSYIIY